MVRIARWASDQKAQKADILIPYKINNLKTAYWISLIFCMNASLRECKKVTFFQENSKIGHFGPSLSKIGTFMAFKVSPEMGVFLFLCVAHASDPA